MSERGRPMADHALHLERSRNLPWPPDDPVMLGGQMFFTQELPTLLDQLLRGVSTRHRKIFGLLANDIEKDVAELIGISSSRVQQIKNKTLARARARLMATRRVEIVA